MIVTFYMNQLNCMIRRKELFCWQFVMPLLFACFLFIGIHEIAVDTSFQSIPVALAGDNEKDTYKDIMIEMEKAYVDSTKKFIVYESDSLESAKALLQNHTVTAAIDLNDGFQVYINEDGIAENIVVSFLKQYEQMNQIVDNVSDDDAKKYKETGVNAVNQKIRMDSQTYTYFFALVGIACFISAFYGLYIVTFVAQNQYPIATRISYAPIRRFSFVLANVLAAFTLCFVQVCVIVAILFYFMGIDMEQVIVALLVILVLGVLSGLSFGMAFGTIGKILLPIKRALILAIALVAGLFAGAFQLDIKYYVETNNPILSFLNPVRCIADSIYSLYYYEDYKSILFNLMVLVGVILICLVFFVIKIRRRTYDHLSSLY